MTSLLTVLGSCGAWPEAGRACSGYVVEHEGARVVLDLGYATLPRLLRLLGSTSADGLDAVVVTHDHPDHWVDLHGLFRARRYSRRDGARVALFAPTSVVALLARLEAVDEAAVAEVFDVRPWPAGPTAVGPFELTPFPLPHHVPNAGVRLSAPGLTVAYTGDTGPDPALADLGRDADLYVVEATDWPGEATSTGPQLNLSAQDAGLAAEASGARRLLLTHFWPGTDREASADVVRRTYSGDVLVADEGLEVELP